MTPSEFAARWKGVETSERASAQTHFIDLCRMLGVGAPHGMDPTGEWYAFEKGAEKLRGGDGFADVWKKGHFAWEYKGKRRDLQAAYRQLKYHCQVSPIPPGSPSRRRHVPAATGLHARGHEEPPPRALSIVLTSNTHGHVLEARQRQVALGMDALLDG